MKEKKIIQKMKIKDQFKILTDLNLFCSKIPVLSEYKKYVKSIKINKK